MRLAVAYIETHAGEDLSLLDIARAASITPRALQYAFRRNLDTTPLGYARRVRLDRANIDRLNADALDGDGAPVMLTSYVLIIEGNGWDSEGYPVSRGTTASQGSSSQIKGLLVEELDNLRQE